jgi:putative copper resistance protein D
MAALIDFFGLMSVLLHGAAITCQSLLLGALAFLILLAWPLYLQIGPAAAAIEARARLVMRLSAFGLVLVLAIQAYMGMAILSDTLNQTFAQVAGAQFVKADLVAIAGSLVLALAATQARPSRQTQILMLLVGLSILGAVVATSHAAARLDNQWAMGFASFLHQLGGAIWLGGLPCFIFALSVAQDRTALAEIGRRYSLMSMAGVSIIVIGATALALVYIGSVEAIFGTAYGAMAAAKTVMFLCLLGLGFANFRNVESLRRDPNASALRLRRFAEVELGAGIAIFFTAASITSLPPAVDLTQNRVTYQEMVDRLTPHWPRLQSPDHADLAIPALQAELDKEFALKQEAAETRPQAFIPGVGDFPPRNAQDIAWSEYNHHWAGLFVIIIGLLALLDGTGWVKAARNWPLVFLGLAVFLFFRSDPEVWPMGDIGLWESMRDPEVVQHRFFVVLTVAFALFEWRVRRDKITTGWAPLVFPLLTAIGGGALLTHSHAIANIKDQLLIELTHLPLAIFGIAAGWARWLEIRLPGRGGRIAGILWPIFFIGVGIVLITYREA